MCRFCSRACEDMAALRDVPAGSPSYLLASVDGFRILSDNAPLVPGHVLIVPDEHVKSFARLSAKSPSSPASRCGGYWKARRKRS